MVVAVVEVVRELDAILVVGGTNMSGGAEEPSAVRITAKINTPTSSTAAAPATKIVPGRLIQCSGSWSGGTPEC
ncbi:hypothetical protein [Mycobacterium sp. 1274761.0]|uniref:hypothetical protein n=1 Tax=Mycobacterium sp. 1274761.0 TaxID=1834077 RepID=UPI00080202EF|nr:hypothetical protein [Mycobacterium sp. 1274761.0]OBK74662.1 hypothetical protein A5651_09325 [Mycobacterium sp. 1274761.0]